MNNGVDRPTGERLASLEAWREAKLDDFNALAGIVPQVIKLRWQVWAFMAIATVDAGLKVWEMFKP